MFDTSAKKPWRPDPPTTKGMFSETILQLISVILWMRWIRGASLSEHENWLVGLGRANNYNSSGGQTWCYSWKRTRRSQAPPFLRLWTTRLFHLGRFGSVFFSPHFSDNYTHWGGGHAYSLSYPREGSGSARKWRKIENQIQRNLTIWSEVMAHLECG